MRYSFFQSPLLQLRLALRLFITFLEVAISPAINPLFLILLFLVTTVTFSSLYFLFQHQFRQTMISFYQQEVTNYQYEAQKEILFWESVASKTPSRDVFYNLSNLYSYLGNQETSEIYRFQAIQLDPNNLN